MFGILAKDQNGCPRLRSGRVALPAPPARGDRGWTVIPLVLCLALVARGAFAQEFDFEEEDAEKAAAAVDPNTFVLGEAQFNSWVFNDHLATSAQYRERFRAFLNARVAELRRVCDLTADQSAKLELAGRGDLARFHDQVEAKRRKFQGKSYTQNELNPIYQEINSLRRKLSQGLFADHSLFAKLTDRLLDDSQRKRFGEVDRERRAYAYACAVDQKILRIGRTAGLTASQRDRLRELILQESQIPRRHVEANAGHYIVLAQMSRIPTEKLRPIFDEAQWPLIQQYLKQGENFQQLVKNNDYLDDEDTDAAPEGKDEASKADASE